MRRAQPQGGKAACTGACARACGTADLPKLSGAIRGGNTIVNATGILRVCLPMMVAAIAGCGAPAQAQSYPTKPIRIVVGFAPGGPSDIISRLVGTQMGEILGP